MHTLLDLALQALSKRSDPGRSRVIEKNLLSNSVERLAGGKKNETKRQRNNRPFCKFDGTLPQYNVNQTPLELSQREQNDMCLHKNRLALLKATF
jgi:hypothetical protein